MEYKILGKTGLMISEIGFGGIPIMSNRTTEILVDLKRITFAQAYETLRYAYENGITFYDTARDYGDSEERIGGALKGVRQKVIIASKSKALTYDTMKEDIDQSLIQLDTDYIDLYQLHFVRNIASYDIIMDAERGAFRALLEAKEAGKIRACGIAAHNLKVLHLAVENDIFDTVQLPLNLIEHEYIDIIDKCRKRNHGTIAMKAYAGGSLTKSTRVTLKYNISDNDVKRTALTFVLNQKIDTVIPGMESIRQVYENLDIYKSYKSGSSDISSKMISTIVKDFAKGFCRRCLYCEPCPAGVPVEMILRLRKYAEDYGLEHWAKSQYGALETNSLECTACGECEVKCPYQIKIRKEISLAHNILYKGY